MFPYLEDEVFVYYQGRAAWKELADNPAKSKYNPSAKEAPLGKSSWLYGVDDAVIGGDMYLVEGTLDRISLHDFLQGEFGPESFALGLSGSDLGYTKPGVHPLNTQFGKISALQPRNISICLDGPKFKGDPGAYAKAVAIAKELRECGFQARAVKLPFGDPNELVRRHPDVLRLALSLPDATGGDAWAHQISLDLSNLTL
jgi:hypothetical protein